MERCFRGNGHKIEKHNNTGTFILGLFTFLISFVFLDRVGTLSYAGHGSTLDNSSIISIITGHKPYVRSAFTHIVTIKDGNDLRKVITSGLTVKDLLWEQNISLSDNQYTKPSFSEYINDDQIIEIIHVKTNIVVKYVQVPFSVRNIDDPMLVIGSQVVLQKGVLGTKEIVNKEIFENGVYIKSETVSEKIVKLPSQEVVKVGTRPKTVHSCSYWGKVVDKYAPESKNKKKNTWMKYVMLCESGCDSGKGFEKYFDGSKAFYGLYQFTEYTFKAYGGDNMFEGEDQIKVVSRMYDMPGNPAHHWPACNRAFTRDYNK